MLPSTELKSFTSQETILAIPNGNLEGRRVCCGRDKAASWVVFVFSLIVGAATMAAGTSMCLATDHQWVLGGIVFGIGASVIILSLLLSPK